MSPQRLAVLILALAVPVAAQDVYEAAARRDEGYAPSARVRYLEGSVTLDRSSEGGSEQAQPNVPFLPGERLLTDDSGRVELQFGSGVVVRLDSRSSLEYLSGDGRPTLRLPSGGLYVHARQGVDLAVETAGGLVSFEDGGVYRIDVASGETRLSVLEGSASLDSAGRRVDVRAGERTYARDGSAPEDPQPFDRGDDEFARWDREREGRTAYARRGESRRYVPREVEEYADDLDDHGSWSHQGDEGYVWRPRVEAGWSPYSDGRWVWTSYGWTWCPYESWGWAPFHYGRWGFRPVFGWYWIPGPVWSPAWVSWSYGGDYVGWCPLGFRDRPVIINVTIINNRYGSSPWIYTRRGDFMATHVAQHRVRLGSSEVSAMKVLSSPAVQPSRDFRSVRQIPAGHARLRALGGPLPTPGNRLADRKRDRERLIPEGRSFDRGRARPIPEGRVFDRPAPRGETGHPTDRRERGRPLPEGRAFERPTPRGEIGHPTDRRRPIPEGRLFDRPAPRGEIGHPSDRRERGRPIPEGRAFERPAPRGEIGHPTDRSERGRPRPIPEGRLFDRPAPRGEVGHPADRREQGRTIPEGRSFERPAPRGEFERGRDIETRSRERGESWGPRERPREVERQPRHQTFERPNGLPRFHNEEARPPRPERGAPRSEARPAPPQRENRTTPKPPEQKHDKRRERDRSKGDSL